MGFRLMILNEATSATAPRNQVDTWAGKVRELALDIEVDVVHSVGEAMEVIGEADAAYGNIVPELFERAGKLRWIQSPQAGPKAGYYHNALIGSDVVVTNMREIYGDHISAHIMAFVLAFARNFHVYIPQQARRVWSGGPDTVHLPEATAVIVGVGGIGSETARVCSAFGMTVIGVDARRTAAPEGVAELHPPGALAEVLPRGDFVIVTVPETPETLGMFGLDEFRLMKPGAYFINIGRGATVVLDDLVVALREGEIAGAGLDVFEIEPLPSANPLWTMPGVLLTPHTAASGPYTDDRRTEVFLDNCVRFNDGKSLRNVVDKALWF